jgi:DNA-3-methyladenine glycosylase
LNNLQVIRFLNGNPRPLYNVCPNTPILCCAPVSADAAIIADQALARIGKSFFDRDVDVVARDLIGATFVVDGVGGVIVETESYDASDPASHSFGMRRAEWTATMFGPPGHAHVYKVYGLHWCLNFVCRVASAVLIRAIEPQHGIERMTKRRGTDKLQQLCSGPGRLCEALAISKALDGASLTRAPLSLTARLKRPQIALGTRIGLTKGVEAERRYGLKDSVFLSKKFPDRP